MRPDWGPQPQSAAGPVEHSPIVTFSRLAILAFALGALMWAGPVRAQTDPPEITEPGESGEPGEIEELESVEPTPPPVEESEPPESGQATGVDPEPANADLEDAPQTRQAPEASPLSGEYLMRLQELEDRVNDLKEEIFRSKSRLVLLRERVLRTTLGGTQAVISHVNDMSATFDLDQVIYSLDGNQIYSATREDGLLADSDVIEIYDGAIVAGPHNISVEMIFVGNGFGVFTYLEGYRFRVRSSHAFTAEEGKITFLDVVAYEQGGVNRPIEERPDVRYEIEFSDSELDDLAGE